MSYLVLARKYRPQTFEEVIGQDHITRTLANAISSDRVAHAILFSGPRGTGKTTVARILAKTMNCKKGPAPIPCNECRSCNEITSGRAVDVYEIDGASNNSVDQIRELRENVRYMPAHSLYKIYIIDEVHMLSKSAFNALLKTLEEPPSHVMFIFATTEPNKIPITILSRCQKHDFRRISMELISKHMSILCSKEGIDIKDESLELIAREADGSMRDALSLLDQVMACLEGTITNDRIVEILGVIDRKNLFSISSAIISGNIPAILDILDDIYVHGHDMKKLYSDLVEHFRNLLVVKMGNKISKLVDLPAHEIDLMSNQVKDISEAYLNQLFNILFNEETTIRFSAQPKIALEMAFIKMFQIKPALSIDELIDKLDTLRQEKGPTQGKELFETQARYGPGKSKIEPQDKQQDKPQNKPQDKKDKLPDTPDSQQDIKGTENIETATISNSSYDLDSTWNRLFEIISKKHPSLAANLANCTLKSLTDQSLEIEVNGNAFNAQMVRRSKNMTILKNICKDIFSKNMKIIITEKIDSNNTKNNKKRDNHLKKEALSHPLITDAIEIFNGKAVDVKII
ncbi:MAG: DNA polymerase III subunit gamma/tau [Thermodesulfobacteriota bacterium]|nr:DNA polymerase III subunit gamma/tau [Thermodesulfobacteriota bacterium]